MKVKRILILLTLACAFACTVKDEVATLTDWLYGSMPLPDSLSHDRAYWEENVRKTLEVRDLMQWNIPQREFRHFVLPLRVNNETLDGFRTAYADTLCRRVRGMSLSEAALEINHWCHEQATYQPSDGRTSSPEATVRRGVGRCGEESVLAVAALRAAGIPARQVYTPRWAHTDDNHAWVEVYTEDGRWHFMGACEPEPVLDMAWFNGSVSRAMLLHTKVFGDYQGPEDVIQRTPCYTEINVIRGYVPARRTVATVVRDGRPVPGARVSFRIYNYAEFFDVTTYTADSKGQAALDTGLGDMLVWASDGEDFGYAVAHCDTVTVTLTHRFGEAFTDSLDIVPPAEHPLPALAGEEAIEANAIRLAEEDAIRAAHSHGNPAVTHFWEEHPDRADEILGSLSAKDLGDVTLEVLEDALLGTGSPRVELEPLLPVRADILASGIDTVVLSPSDAVRWVQENITVVDGRNPQNLRTPAACVWRARKADPLGRDLFFVALCRALGFPARMDLVTGKVQYDDGGAWVDVDFGLSQERHSPAGTVLTGSKDYYNHFTFTRIGPGGSQLMDYESGVPDAFSLEAGYYLMTCGSRMADGSVLVSLDFFTLDEGEILRKPPVLRTSSEGIAVLGSMDPEVPVMLEDKSASQSLLSVTGRGYFLAVVAGEKDEPSLHAKAELEAAAPLLSAWGRPVVICGRKGAGCIRPGGLEISFGVDAEGALERTLTTSEARGDRPGAVRLPVVAICDSFGRIVYYSEGYNTSLAADLRRVIPKL